MAFAFKVNVIFYFTDWRTIMKYNIIYADPPWKYRVYDKSDAAHGAATAHYPTMPLEDIKALPVKDLAAKNAALFLWVTDPLIPEGLEVMKEWGFRYVTVGFYWVKLNKNGKPFFGLGHYTRGNPELCFLGLKGSLPRVSKSVEKLVIAERGRHSEKPGIVRDQIVELFGDIPRLEMFARTVTPGWDVWGNEVESDVAL